VLRLLVVRSGGEVTDRRYRYDSPHFHGLNGSRLGAESLPSGSDNRLLQEVAEIEGFARSRNNSGGDLYRGQNVSGR